MKTLTRGLCAAALLATLAPAACAQIVNASFEDPPLDPGQFINGVPPGWTFYDPTGSFEPTNSGVYNPTGIGYYTAPTPEGNNLGYLFSGGGGTFPAFGLSQTLTDTLQPKTHYTLQVAVGDPASAGGFDLDGFPGYAVQLLAGDTLLAEDNNTLAGTFAEGTFATSTLTYVTGAADANLGQPLEIRLLMLNQGEGLANNEVDFDDVRLSAAPVPGPQALPVFASGLLLVTRLLWMRRK